MPQVQRQQEPVRTCFSLPMQLPCLSLGLLQLYWRLQQPCECLTSLLTHAFLGCCGSDASCNQQRAATLRDGVIPGQGLCCIVWGDDPSGLRPLSRDGHSWLDNHWQHRGHRGNRPGHGRNVSTPSGFAEGAAPSCPGAWARCQRFGSAFSQLLHPQAPSRSAAEPCPPLCVNICTKNQPIKR